MRVTETSPRRTVVPVNFRFSLHWVRSSTALRWLPFVATAFILLCGYLLRVSGVSHPNDYHIFTFKSLNYSDIIWLYIRDQTAQHPLPFLDYQLEYPPLTGGLIYLLGYAPTLPAYFALTYALLTLAGLGTVGALGGISGAKRWYFAAAPGLFLTGGLNWDLAAIAMTALALLAFARGRDGWGTLALVVAVWLKLFPIVFLGAILVDRLREWRWRDIVKIGGIFALGSAAINLPIYLVNPAGWTYFFNFNNERRAEPSIWTLLPNLTTAEVNRGSIVLLVLGGAVLASVALRSRTPVAPLLGATLLVWWLFVNKIYSPQYGLWVYLALALVATPRPLWVAFALFDAAYYFASFQILYTSMFDNETLVEWQTRYLVHPLVVVRLLLLGAITCWSVYLIWRTSHRGEAKTSPPLPVLPAAVRQR